MQTTDEEFDIPTATGKYRLEGACAEFFRTPVLRVIVRGSNVVGRFGRRGLLRGTLRGRTISADWQDDGRKGWLQMEFEKTYRSCECDYGTYNDAPVSAGHAVLSKIGRRPRSA